MDQMKYNYGSSLFTMNMGQRILKKCKALLHSYQYKLDEKKQ